MKNLLITSLMLVLSFATIAACQNAPKTVNTDPNAVYACPMHPEITGKAGDKCSKCHMNLEATSATAAPTTTDATPASTATPTVATSGTTQVQEQPLSAVYASYFNLKNALAKDDGKGAQAAAKTLFDDIAAVPMDKLDAEKHAVWMKYQNKLSVDAEHIKGLDKIKRQREYFVSLSKNMHEVMKSIKNDAPIYYQNCPMYDGGKGANWLSLDSKISNPYFGKEMLTCGKTVETIQ